jgi:hypothetical protein
MKVLSIQLRFCCKLTLIAFILAAPTIKAQSSAVHVEAAPSEQHLRSRLFIYDLHEAAPFSEADRQLRTADRRRAGLRAPVQDRRRVALRDAPDSGTLIWPSMAV